MALTAMYEIFILLEDEKHVPLYRLNRWGRKTRGVLSKLKKLGWAKKISKNNETGYEISEDGEKAIDEFLKPLKRTGIWDGRWRLVMFDVPEKKRALRDTLRRELTKLGLGILQSSVWITPIDVKNEIESLVGKYQLGGQLKFFEVTHNKNLDQTIIEKAWKMSKLSDEYRRFNVEALRILKLIDKEPNQRFTAKKLIFEYALLLQKDPVLPAEFRTRDEARTTAHELYLKLRSYAVNLV